MVYALIMAGGIGSRFWPKSRTSRPKQFLDFFDHQTLLQSTIERITPLIPLKRVIVSTNNEYVDLVKNQIPDLPVDNIIGEPVAKNTAPCIAFASALIHHRDPDATMIVLPSDHYIRNNDVFLEDLKACMRFTNQKGHLVTIGISPTRPETGYGYIQYNDNETITVDGIVAHPVKTFAEKPDLQTAIKFLQSGDFLWNSGMFIWKTEHILKEIEEHLPVLHHQVNLFYNDLQKNNGSIRNEMLTSVYNSCFPVSIDYGIMEKSNNVIVIPSHFDWSDLGSWMALYELKSDQSDDNKNIFDAPNVISVHSENCYLESRNNKLIAMVGLDGIGVIETDDAMLICKLEKSQDVKELYSMFSKKQKQQIG
ncbi:MAG: mannose-1-phosphate guanylyltransferase [Balneolales bacterium]